MADKVYTIVQIEWQYNDEYYYTSEEGGGKAVAVWRDKSNAEKECCRLNRISARGKDYSSFGSRLGEEPFWRTTETDETKKLLERLNFPRDEAYEFVMPDSASDDDVDALLKFFGIEYYKLQEVDFHG